MICRNFENKAGIVTGAASGIGFAMARLVAERGGRVAMADIDSKELERAAEKIRKDGGQIVAVPGDISKEADVAQLVDRALAAFGRIEFLVNNAGILFPTEFLSLTPAEWDQVLGVNLRGAYLCCRAVLPGMVERKKGVIVNVSSQAGRSASRLGGAHYTSSKAGLIGLTRALALEMGPHGIRVNSLCPGPTLTPLVTGKRSPEKIAAMSAGIPLRRYSQPDEQAVAAVFLLSDESSYITGACLDCNGGLFML